MSRVLLGWLLAAGVAACNGEVQPQHPPLGSIPTDDLVYENTAAGVTVTFPPSWHDRYDVDARSGPIAAAQWPLTISAIEFLYKPVEPDQPDPPLFTLLVYRKAGWNQIEADSAPGAVVAEAGDDVYVAAVAGTNPFTGDSRDAANFESMRLTLSQVKEALTLR